MSFNSAWEVQFNMKLSVFCPISSPSQCRSHETILFKELYFQLRCNYLYIFHVEYRSFWCIGGIIPSELSQVIRCHWPTDKGAVHPEILKLLYFLLQWMSKVVKDINVFVLLLLCLDGAPKTSVVKNGCLDFGPKFGQFTCAKWFGENTTYRCSFSSFNKYNNYYTYYNYYKQCLLNKLTAFQRALSWECLGVCTFEFWLKLPSANNGWRPMPFIHK